MTGLAVFTLLAIAMLALLVRRGAFASRVLVVGTSPIGRRIVVEMLRRPRIRERVAGVVVDDAKAVAPPLSELIAGPLSRLGPIIRDTRPDRIVIALTDRRGRLPMRELLAAQEGHRFRSAPLPPSLRRASMSEASAAYDPATLAEAIGGLLEMPERVDVRHMVGSRVTVAERLTHLRALLRRGSFSFDEAVLRADRVTIAVTLYALLELHKQGELTWTQDEPFGEITIAANGAHAARAEERLTA